MVLAVLFGTVGCAASVGGRAATVARSSGAGGVPPELARFSEFLVELAGRLERGVVSVHARRVLSGNAHGATRSPDAFRIGRASGFVIDPNGTIVTSGHVVDGAESLSVRLSDGRHFDATVLGKDMTVDLALLKIEAGARLTALPIGNSDEIRVGELVLGLGHPFGVEPSVSFGIVSRKGPVQGATASDVDLIQTDAAVYPGHSGGPLVSLAGEVIGITSTVTRSGALGFAIPANTAKRFLSSVGGRTY